MGFTEQIPNCIVVMVPGVSFDLARSLALDAVQEARANAPKLTIASSSTFSPMYGEGWFGVQWEHNYVWFQESGTKPHTMRSLAGKTIPMWINDPKGEERAKNPKAKTRITADGRTQVLVFRRAARIGQRKTVYRPVGGKLVPMDVPASFPGAPGRIAVNRSQGILRAGDVSKSAPNVGAIASGNVGVRWRHPGLNPGRFLARGVASACRHHKVPVGAVSYQRAGQSREVQAYSPVVYTQ